MANVIKHKRGSGSDPGASDLILGELAIRTDTGKLFTKMDSGAIAEIAGGGSDIAINTLSSSYKCRYKCKCSDSWNEDFS
jgi:hypothetical protein